MQKKNHSFSFCIAECIVSAESRNKRSFRDNGLHGLHGFDYELHEFFWDNGFYGLNGLAVQANIRVIRKIRCL